MAYTLASASSQYLETGSSPLSGYVMSFGGWVRLASKATSQAIACVGTFGSNVRQQIYFAAAGSRFYAETINAGGTGAGNFGTTDPVVGTWYHVMGVFHSDSLRELWVNGVKEMTNTTYISGVSGQNRLLIGARRNSANVAAFMDGDLGDLGFWNVALSASDIASLAKAAHAQKVRPQSLKAYHPLIRENVATIGPAFTAYNSPTVAAHPRLYL